MAVFSLILRKEILSLCWQQGAPLMEYENTGRAEHLVPLNLYREFE